VLRIKAPEDRPHLAQCPQDGADQARLHHRDGHAIGRERHAPTSRASQPNAVLRPVGPDRGIDEVRHLVGQHHRQKRAHARKLPDLHQPARRVGAPPVEGAAPVLRERLGQHQPAEDEVHPARIAAATKGARGSRSAEEPAQQRAEDEAHPETRRDQAEILRPFAGFGDVGHEGQCGRMRRRRHARDEPPASRSQMEPATAITT
jgi:hypothetical protein